MSIDIAALKQEVGLEPYDNRLNLIKSGDEYREDAKTPKLIRIAQRPSELSTKPIEWIIEGVYPKHGLSIVAGREGIGKGNHALLSIAAILSGGQFLGRPTQKVPIIYVDLENPEAVIRDRLQRLDLVEAENFWIWGQWNEIPPPANLDDPIYLEAAEKTGALFYFDSLIDFAEGKNENDASEISSILLKARYLARRCAGVNIQHHADKYGKSGWRGNPETTTCFQCTVKACINQ
jgi:RecA-family ATPase